MPLKKFSRLVLQTVAALALAAATSAAASAAAVTFTGTGNTSTQSASAKAVFDIVGSNLIVTLTNTTPGPTKVDQPSLLMGVYWSSNSLGTLASGSLASVDLVGGSSLVGGTNPGWFGLGLGSGGVLGQYGLTQTSWSLGTTYDLEQLTGAPAPGTPVVPDGPDGGLISPTGTTSGKVTIQSSVQYTVALPASVNKSTYLASISNVQFIYGTGGDDGRLIQGGPTPVPVPAALWGGGSLLGLLGVRRLVKKV